MENILILNPPISFRYHLNLKLLWILTFILISALLVFYIFQVNSLTSQIYLFQNQERKLTEIKKENESLEIDFSKANSLVNIENYFKNQGFEKAKRVKYIQILETSVVAK